MKEADYIQKRIVDYFLGSLTEAEEKELFHWLAADEKNKQLFLEMSDWWAISHVPYFSSRVESGFQQHFSDVLNTKSKRLSSKFLFIRPWLQVAVVALFILAIGGLYFYAGTSMNKESERRYETFVPLGSRSKLVLSDGSVVWLNAGSSLSYNSDFSKGSREVYLTGEGFFDITPDSLKPFVVKSATLNVKVLGTTFDVRAYEDEEQVNVVLRTGKVDVSLKGGEVIHLQPNDKLSYNKIYDEIDKTKVNARDVCEWINGKLKFTKMSFATLVKDLERIYNVKIKVESSSLLEETFSGSINLQNTIYDVLHEININKKYKWTQTGNEFVIRDR